MFKMNKWVMAAVTVGLPGLHAGALGAFDNFDGYADGTNLLTSGGNGQFVYMTPAPSGGGFGSGDSYTAVLDAGATSAPNVARFSDAGTVFPSLLNRITPAYAIDMSAPGTTAKIEFDFATVSGPGGRLSMSIRPMWSVDANAGAEDWIDNTHTSGLSDGGLYFLNNGNVLGALTNRYQPQTWYHWDMTAVRRADLGIDYTLDIRRISDNFSLDGPIASTAPSNGGRFWLTGLGFYSSSNPNETILIDNLSITPEPASALLLLSGAAVLFRRRKA